MKSVKIIIATILIVLNSNAKDLDWGNFENNKSWWNTWGGITTIVDNPFPDENATGKVLKYVPDSLWRGISIYFVEPPLKVYHKKISFDVYADTTTAIQLGFPSSNMNDTFFIKRNIWEKGWRHLEFDISNLKTYSYKYIIIQTIEMTNYYFDNFKVLTDSSYTNMPSQNGNSPKLYPNPSKDFITITNIDDNTEIRIFNIAGGLIFKSIINNYETIPVFNFQYGIYTIKIEFNGKTSTRKFVKL